MRKQQRTQTKQSRKAAPTIKARAVGINHVVLEVDDVDAALEFYGQFLEFSLRSRSARSAFIDLGDQFLVLTVKRTQQPDKHRHIGLVVDDCEAMRLALEGAELKMRGRGGLDFLDPWGNRVQIVDYRNIQFSKLPAVLGYMGLGELEKTPQAKRKLDKKIDAVPK